jgi:ubiquinone/menaquinone biosynthesis C-methylase UbiE
VSFDVGADAYERFMGRYSVPLAAEFVAITGPAAGRRALDVGCGTGALTAELVRVLGTAAVSAVDPSESFVSATRSRFPAVDVRRAGAEHLPFADDAFDFAYAQLVVHFMADPVAGVREMARVTRPGGVGPAGDYVRGLDARRRDELRGRCAALLPRAGTFDIVASAWTALGRTR